MTLPLSSQSPLILIFLDMDGVLLPFNCKRRSSCGAIFPDTTLEALNRICTAFDGDSNDVQIVLTSTWRVQESFRNDILNSFQSFNYAYGASIPTKFYSITDPNIHSERQHEIYQWLLDHNHLDDTTTSLVWIALDDEELMEGVVNEKRRAVFEGRVIKTDSHVGLTDQDAEMAIRLLRAQLQQH